MDSQEAELTLKQLPRHEKFPTPALAHVTSPSPAKARRRTDKPRLSAADSLGPVKLPSELFAIATSRNSQGDMALTKALDGIQAAATRLETERAKLVIQSQELQIWDMAREEELILLRAENEQLEQQLAAMSEKISKGFGRDGVLDSLQFALRKARLERDAEVREADALFNQLQEARAAEEELRQLRSALSSALSKLSDEWSAIPLLSDEARELRAKADIAVHDPTNLGQEEMVTLLRGLLKLASRGMELQREAQTLRGEKAALQTALDAAHQQLTEQAEQLQPPPQSDVAAKLAATASQGSALERLGRRRAATHRWSLEMGRAAGHLPPVQPNDELVSGLRNQVLELETKLAEYRSFLEDNQQEIERLQAELKRLRGSAQPSVLPDAAAGATSAHGKPLPHPGAPRGLACGSSRGAAAGGGGGGRLAAGSSLSTGSLATATHPSVAVWRRQQEQQQQQQIGAAQGTHQPLAVAGTPTRHVPSSSSPISTINYGTSPPGAVTSSARGSPLPHQPVVDIALKVAELQELALRVQQQATEREADAARQHELAMEALRQELAQQKAVELAAVGAQLSQQHAQELAHAQAREAELTRQHAQTVQELEERMAMMAVQHAQALPDLKAKLEALAAQHAQALAEAGGRAAQRLQAREEELERLHAEALEQQAAQLKAHAAQALAEQAEHLRQQHAQDQRQLEERLVRQHAEQQAWLEGEARRRHAERLAEQAAQLAALHAEQAAALGVQHAESMADFEAQLQQKFERELQQRSEQLRAALEQELQEREDQLASAHASQLREMEARSAAQAAAAAEEREAQLQHRFAEQLAKALQAQHASLAAEAEAQLAGAADQAAAELERTRVLLMEDVARLGQQQREEARRREKELVRKLEEMRRRVSELEEQLAGEAARSGSPVGVDFGDTDRGAMGSAPVDGGSTAYAGDWVRPTVPSDRSLQADTPGTCGLRLAHQGDVAAHPPQQHAQEMGVAADDGERRREATVIVLERQYVEVVSRLGREHEKASAELRSSHELREATLLRALERQAQEARDLQRKGADRIRELQDQLAELYTLLEKERRQHVASNEALQERINQLASELEEALQREAELRWDKQQRHQAGGSQSRLTAACPAEEQINLHSSERAVPESPSLRQPPTATLASVDCGVATSPDESVRETVSDGVAIHSAATTDDDAGRNGSSRSADAAAAFTFASTPVPGPSPALDAWPDGQTLLWPEHGATSNTRPVITPSNYCSGSTASGNTRATAEGLAGPLVPTPVGQETSSASGPAPEGSGCEEWVHRSDQDLAANLVRALRVLESGPGPAASSAVGSCGWNSSPEQNDRKAPRRGLLQSPQHAASSPVVARELKRPLDAAARAEGVGPGLGGVGRTGANRCCQTALGTTTPPQQGAQALPPVPPTLPPLPPAPGAPLDRESAGAAKQVAAEEWGEMVSAPERTAAEEDEVPPAGDAPVETRRGYLSEAATSVSTTSSYNSDTEFYVDDEDDEDQRGRALVAALAQSPRSSQSVESLPPPLLLEIQQRRRARSAGPASPAGDMYFQGQDQDPLAMPTCAEAWVGRSCSCPSSGLQAGASAVAPQDAGSDAKPADAYGASSTFCDLEATLSGPLPKFDLRLLPGDAEPEAGCPASGAIDVPLGSDLVSQPGATAAGSSPAAGGPEAGTVVTPEATLSALAPAITPFPPLPASPPEDPTPAGHPDAAPTCAPTLVQSGSFTFSSPDRTAGHGDSNDAASSSGEASSGGKEQDLRPACNQRRAPDLISSFVFTAMGLSCSPAKGQCTADTPTGDQEGLGVRSGRASSSSGTSGGEYSADTGGGSGGGAAGGARPGAVDFSPSSSSLSTPSTNSCPSATHHSPQWASWAIRGYLDDDERGAGAVSHAGIAAASGSATPVQLANPWGGDWPSSGSGADTAGRGNGTEEDSPHSSGSDLIGQRSDRSPGRAMGVVPLMAANPIFEDECGEPSPPWSAAEWRAVGENGVSPLANEGVWIGPGSSRDNYHPGGPSVGAKRTAGFLDWSPPRADEGPDADVNANVDNGSGRPESVKQRDRDPVSARCLRDDADGSICGDKGLPGPEGQRGQSCGEGQPQRSWSSPYRLAAWVEGPEVLGDESREEGDRREEDDILTLLAAGASLSSSERRRRQRRRMDEAPPISLAGHQVNLLRQSWKFIHGVATPLSPRSAPHHGRVQGHTLGHAPSPRLSYSFPRDLGPRSECPRTLTAAASEEALRENALLPLRSFSKSQSPSPRSSPRIGVPLATGVASPAKSIPSTPRPAIQAGGTDLIAQASPHTPALGPPSIGTDPEGLCLQQQQWLGSMQGLASVGDAARWRLSPCATVSAPGKPMGAAEVRRRSREVLERAMSRVAELEGQCRALAMSLPPQSPSGELSLAASPAPQPLPWVTPHSLGPQTQAQHSERMALLPAPGSSSMVSADVLPAAAHRGSAGSPGDLTPMSPHQLLLVGAAVAAGGSTGDLAPVSVVLAASASPPPSPAVAAVVIDALEVLRGDLAELEQLHHHTMCSGLTPAPGIQHNDKDGEASLEHPAIEAGSGPQPFPVGPLLLTDAAAEGAAVPGAEESLRKASRIVESAAAGGGDSLPGRGAAGGAEEPQPFPGSASSGEGVGACGAEQARQQPARAATLPLGGQAQTPPLQQQQRSYQHYDQGPELVRGQQGAGATATPGGPGAVAPLGESREGTGAPHENSAGPAAPPLPARSPPSGPSSPGLDPTLVSLLQLSIQAQLQGQLGQLQAKIAELQRQNEALLLAATTASTPATPLPPADPLQRGSRAPTGLGVGISLTPLPMPPFTVLQTPSPANSCSGFGAGVMGSGLIGALSDSQVVGVREDLAGAGTWGAVGLALADGGAGAVARPDTLAVLQGRASLPQAQQAVRGSVDIQPSGLMGDTLASGHTSISVFPGALLVKPLGQLPGTVPLGEGGSGALRGSTPAGPYSPEELSQLPATVQLYAPPLLRAAALAAAHEQQRRTT